jgi:predicted Zn finger-like uncharacterized protein
MILTCPECATRYFVDDERLGASGRTVRCAACGANWKAVAEEPLELVASPEEGALARVPGEAASFRPNDPSQLSDLRAPELPKTFRAKAEQKRRVREAAAAGVVWGLMCAGFALVLGAAYLFRVDVVKLYPKAAGAYAWVGAPVNPTGLALEKIAATPALDGLAAVTVSGVVRNVVDHPAAPPPVRVALLDKSGARIATQVLRLPANPIAPGKAQPFSISLPDPKAAAADVDVAFALDLAPPPRADPRRLAARAVAPRPAPVAQKPIAAVAQAQSATLTAVSMTGPAKPAPPLAGAGPGLRPALGVPTQRETEARPLPPSDPYALNAAPHG